MPKVTDSVVCVVGKDGTRRSFGLGGHERLNAFILHCLLHSEEISGFWVEAMYDGERTVVAL